MFRAHKNLRNVRISSCSTLSDQLAGDAARRQRFGRSAKNAYFVPLWFDDGVLSAWRLRVCAECLKQAHGSDGVRLTDLNA